MDNKSPSFQKIKAGAIMLVAIGFSGDVISEYIHKGYLSSIPRIFVPVYSTIGPLGTTIATGILGLCLFGYAVYLWKQSNRPA